MKRENLLTIAFMWSMFIMLLGSTLTTKITSDVSTVNLQEEVVVEELPDIKNIKMERFLSHGLIAEEVSEKEVVEEEPVEVIEEIIEEEVQVEVVEEVIEEDMQVEEVTIIEDIPYQWQPIDSNFDIFQPSYLNRDELIYALGDIRSGLHSSVDSIILAEEIYGVNSLYLASVLGYESGWGRYENGWNNIAGWKGNYGTFSDFASRHECIMAVAEGLVNTFQPKVGNRVGDVAVLYCPDYGYLDTLLTIMGELDYNL